MVRTEKVSKPEESNIRLPQNKFKNKQYSRAELDDMIIRLAEAHGIA